MTRDRRRVEAHRLAGEGVGVREIARRLDVNPSTISRDLREPPPTIAPLANLQDAAGRPVAGAEIGNSRSMTHGTNSERAIAPLREKHVAELRGTYPRLDGRRLALLADRLARIELATSWLDAQGGVVRDEEGEVFAVVKELERWASRAEAVLAEVEEEHRQARRFDALEGFLEDDNEVEEDDDGEDE